MYITERDRTRIYKKDNSIVGSPYKYASIATQKDFDTIEQNKIANELKVFDFEKINLERLRKIKKIIVAKTS